MYGRFPRGCPKGLEHLDAPNLMIMISVSRRLSGCRTIVTVSASRDASSRLGHRCTRIARRRTMVPVSRQAGGRTTSAATSSAQPILVAAWLTWERVDVTSYEIAREFGERPRGVDR